MHRVRRVTPFARCKWCEVLFSPAFLAARGLVLYGVQVSQSSKSTGSERNIVFSIGSTKQISIRKLARHQESKN